MAERQCSPQLQLGMTVGVIALSSPSPERVMVARGTQRLEQRGFRVVFGAHAHDRREYLAGNDDHRAHDIHAMFARATPWMR